MASGEGFKGNGGARKGDSGCGGNDCVQGHDHAIGDGHEPVHKLAQCREGSSLPCRTNWQSRKAWRLLLLPGQERRSLSHSQLPENIIP